MESLEFTDDEIKRQLAALGYFDVSQERMKQFRKDLHKLIENDRSTSASSSWYTGGSSPSSNSDFSENEKYKATKPSTLSRFQPHIKCPPKQDYATSSSSAPPDSSWMSQSSISKVLWATNTDKRYPGAKNANVYCSNFDDVKLLEPRDGTLKLTLQSQLTRGQLTPSTSHHFAKKMDHSDTESDDITERSITPAANESKVIRKRKVLRKQSDGTPRVFDESLMEDPHLGTYRNHDISIDDSDPRLARVTQRPHLPPRPHSTRPAVTWKKDSECHSFVGRHQPPSYIRPNTSNPHTRNLKKTDPVNRYHKYKDFWTNVKAPGEKSHNALRWEMKAQMMYKEEPAPKPQRIYVPNSYVVPTSKKRSALRWEVRHAMENGLPLPTTFDVY